MMVSGLGWGRCDGSKRHIRGGLSHADHGCRHRVAAGIGRQRWQDASFREFGCRIQ